MGDRCVAILSGGLDSATAAAVAKNAGNTIVAAVFYHYEQKHRRAELECAIKLATQFFGTRLFQFTLPPIMGSALLEGAEINLPKGRTMQEIADGGIAPSYVPNRNMIMIAHASSVAYALKANALIGGWHSEDTSGYPDCTPQFLAAAEEAVYLGTGKAINRIYMPLIHSDKAAVVQQAFISGVPIEMTWSCYDPVVTPTGFKACGKCDSCTIRLDAFRRAGKTDPIPYA